jgi:hypothetical protein
MTLAIGWPHEGGEFPETRPHDRGDRQTYSWGRRQRGQTPSASGRGVDRDSAVRVRHMAAHTEVDFSRKERGSHRAYEVL